MSNLFNTMFDLNNKSNKNAVEIEVGDLMSEVGSRNISSFFGKSTEISDLRPLTSDIEFCHLTSERNFHERNNNNKQTQRIHFT